ncbi:MAG TPA: Smr/MutS family protein [Gallionellaceae bacterium]|nr:Smr/MutS family protein [Gallionellaceae bacterium]
MKKNLEQPAPSDGELFQQAVEGVTPIAPSNRVLPSPPVRCKPPRSTVFPSPAISDSLSDHHTSDEAPSSFLRSGLNNMTLRKLRRGQWPVQDTIDLHGHTSEEARRFLVEFLHHALHHGLRCVCVIHGKGWRAEGGEGILKIRVRNWLTQHPQVLAFCEAPANAGGGGAVWVLLKSTG